MSEFKFVFITYVPNWLIHSQEQGASFLSMKK
jgi:hypothetical protein